MRNPILIACMLLSIFAPVLGNEWPVYNPAPFTSPVPDPANSGTGVLERYKIAPNEKIIKESDPDEEWTVEFDSPNRIKLSSSIDGPQGTFLNGQKCRSNNKRIVLTPMGPNNVIIENTPGDGDKFYFTVTGAASKNENFMTLFGDYNDNPDVEFWHGAMDVRVSGTPNIAAPASVYPVRSGTVRQVDKDKHHVAVEVAGSPGVYDSYDHVEYIEVRKGETIVATGPNATRIASHVIHSVPHLHFEVSDWYENEPTPPTPLPKAIRNPLNGIVLFTDSSKPETKEIRFRSDDYATPTPIFNRRAEHEEDGDRSGFFEFISGKMDVIARVSDDNDANDIGPPEQSCGIHQIQYKIFEGFDLSGVILQEGILFNDTTFRGEHPAFDNEYTPYYFDLYSGCHSVPWTDAFDEYNTRNFEYHYIVTNNTNPAGAKSGLSRLGCWDTEATIAVPTSAATPYAKIFPDGPYTVLIQSSDIAPTPNWSDDADEANRKTITVKNEYDRVYYVEAGYTPLPAPTPRGSINNPFGTINEAVKTPLPGYRTLVYLKPGTYQTGESFPVQIPGNFTISGTDQSNTIVAGNGSGPVFKFSANNSELSNLTVLYGGSNEEAQVVVEGYDAVIENCRIDGSGAAASSGIYLHMNENSRVNNCLILNHSENGILLEDVRYPDISNCVF